MTNIPQPSPSAATKGSVKNPKHWLGKKVKRITNIRDLNPNNGFILMCSNGENTKTRY